MDRKLGITFGFTFEVRHVYINEEDVRYFIPFIYKTLVYLQSPVHNKIKRSVTYISTLLITNTSLKFLFSICVITNVGTIITCYKRLGIEIIQGDGVELREIKYNHSAFMKKPKSLEVKGYKFITYKDPECQVIYIHSISLFFYYLFEGVYLISVEFTDLRRIYRIVFTRSH